MGRSSSTAVLPVAQELLVLFHRDAIHDPCMLISSCWWQYIIKEWGNGIASGGGEILLFGALINVDNFGP